MKATNLAAESEQWGRVESTEQTFWGNSKTSSNENVLNQRDTDGCKENSDDGVILEISDEAKKKYAKQMHVLNRLKQMQEQNRKANEKREEEGDELAKIMTIFRRIANGDIVPASDEQKLMEYNKEMYMAAKNIASMKENDDPEEYDSVDKDKKNKSKVAEAMEEYVSRVTESGNTRIETPTVSEE